MRVLAAALAFAVFAPSAGAQNPIDVEAKILRDWLVVEHGKLAAAALADGLVEEACGEYSAILVLDPANAAAKKSLGDAGNPWTTRWDDILQRKYVAWAAKKKTMSKTAATKWLALADYAFKITKDQVATEAAWHKALEYDPDNQQAHDRLKESLVKGVGWIPKEEATKRASGLLPIGDKWLPAKDVVERRKKWAEAWVVKGPHFEVTSNESYDGAVDVLARAEEMYHALTREFSGLVDAPKPEGLMKIFYFASREDLDEHDRTAHGDRPGLRQAPGFFSNEDQVGHFFPLPSNALSTLSDVIHHEGAHEVAYWMMPAHGNNPTNRPNFWVWEGLACYFESTETRDGKVIVGNPNHLRIKTARDEMAAGKAIPIAEFVKLDQRGVSGKYPQAAGLVHFFMNAGNGKYRKPFAEYCRLVHEGLADDGTFKKAFGKDPDIFEREWRDWIAALK